MIEHFDLALATTWEFDVHLVQALEASVQSRRGLTSFKISENNIEETIYRVKRSKLSFGLMLDRAFDVDERYEQLGMMIVRRGGTLVNDYKKTRHAIDKASMHLELMSAGLHVPFSIIISPFAHIEEIGLTLEDLAHLGSPFIIKPANTTGGGVGVVTGAETLLDVLETRKEFQEDKYLIQEKIHPRIIDGRRCWFRCYYVYEKVFLCWWDDLTHEYAEVTTAEEHYYKLRPLRKIMQTIAKLTGLNFFSTEIALRTSTSFEPSNFVAVDYVNDMCDMRTRDIAHDGVPNALFERIVERLTLATARLARQRT